MELSEEQIEKMKIRYTRQLDKMRQYNNEHKDKLNQMKKERYNKLKENEEAYNAHKEKAREKYYIRRGLPVPETKNNNIITKN